MSLTIRALPPTTIWISEPSEIAKFNRGPVTGTFSQPAACFETLTTTDGISNLHFGHWGDLPYKTACYPSATQASLNWDIYYYSPAQCPSEWGPVKTFEGFMEGYAGTSISIGSDTTALLCCPLGYTSTDGHQCYSELPTNTLQWVLALPTSTVQIYTLSSGNVVSGDGIPVFSTRSIQISAMFYPHNPFTDSHKSVPIIIICLHKQPDKSNRPL
ncbi:hypothetical protein VTL71DRAFT_6946 [Oculimacula yallundae]|uniref:Uncharacterized protein n=1 Tax=Oculimacula yallundae TaxID=86028 RepID=A0ABR4BVB6_9HELO